MVREAGGGGRWRVAAGRSLSCCSVACAPGRASRAVAEARRHASHAGSIAAGEQSARCPRRAQSVGCPRSRRRSLCQGPAAGKRGPLTPAHDAVVRKRRQRGAVRIQEHKRLGVHAHPELANHAGAVPVKQHSSGRRTVRLLHDVLLAAPAAPRHRGIVLRGSRRLGGRRAFVAHGVAEPLQQRLREVTAADRTDCSPGLWAATEVGSARWEETGARAGVVPLGPARDCLEGVGRAAFSRRRLILGLCRSSSVEPVADARAKEGSGATWTPPHSRSVPQQGATCLGFR